MLTEKPWRPEAVVIFIGLQLMCLCLGALIVGLLDKAGVAAFNLKDGFGAVVVGTLSFQGATWGLIGFFLWQHDRDWREFFGLRDPLLGRALGRAALMVAALLPVLGGLLWLSGEVLTRLHWAPAEELAVQLVESASSRWSQAYMGFFAIVMAPVAEEFIFRGMLFPFVKQLGFPRLAWFGVSALFALIHASAVAFVPLLVLALALTWLYNNTGNLLAPITVHALFNAANFVWILTAPSLLVVPPRFAHLFTP